MGRKVSDGKAVTVLSTAAVVHRVFAKVGAFIGLNLTDGITAAGKKMVLEIAPFEYESSQITVADAFAVGDKVYWNDATKLLTTASAAGANPYLGIVTVAKDANNVIQFVRTANA